MTVDSTKLFSWSVTKVLGGLRRQVPPAVVSEVDPDVDRHIDHRQGDLQHEEDDEQLHRPRHIGQPVDDRRRDTEHEGQPRSPRATDPRGAGAPAAAARWYSRARATSLAGK